MTRQIDDDELHRLREKLAATEAERDQYMRSVLAMGDLLTGAANALRGAPPDDCDWSTHDVPELAARAAAVAYAALAIGAPGADHQAREGFVAAVLAWREVAGETVVQAVEMRALQSASEQDKP